MYKLLEEYIKLSHDYYIIFDCDYINYNSSSSLLKSYKYV